MTDEELKAMSKDEANQFLSYKDKRRWVDLHNIGYHLSLVTEQIEDVPPEGWYF